MTKRLPLLLLILLLVTAPALAQTGNEGNPAPSGQANSTTGVVTGSITNRTPAGVMPQTGEPMLHIWDSAFREKEMEHGQMLEGGTFRFEEVSFVPGWQYAVMLNYQDVNYYSEPVTVVAEQSELSVEVPIYEATTSTEAVRVMRQHIFFDTAVPGELLVGEIYILSNDGDRTVAPAAGADPGAAPLAFVLPEGAQNIGLDNNTNGRFQPTEAGFIDTAPLRPGEGTAEVVVRYTLPYDDALAYTFSAPWPVDALNLLLPARTGLTLEGDGLQLVESRQMGDGGEVAVFNHEEMAAGDTLSVQLSGELLAPPVAAAETDSAAPAASGSSLLAPSIVALGVFLLALAFWLSRRPPPELVPATMPSLNFESLVTEIALLDEAHEAGRINETDYTRRRSLLFAQAQQLLPEGQQE